MSAFEPGREAIEVFMPEGIQAAFNDWLTQRGCYLFPLPSERDTDLPAYGIGFQEAE